MGAVTLLIIERQKLVRRAAIASSTVAIFLILLKSGAYFYTESISILSSLLDSLLDAGASIVNLIAIARATRPADSAHRFGHGKAEALAGLGQATFISISAGLLVWRATIGITEPYTLSNSGIGIGVMVIAIIITIGLVIYQRRVITATQSTAISADSLHYAGDILLNSSVILALVLTGFFPGLPLDSIFAIGIACWIGYGAVQIVIQSSQELMDRELPDAEREKILKLALSVPGVHDIHDFRTRRSGQRIFLEIHAEMDPNQSLLRAHTIAEGIMVRIEKEYPHAEIIVHQDPEGVIERRQEIQ